jgi:hypothetical protein
LHLLQSLRSSALYSADQNTYILYPDKTLPSFLSKNTLTVDQVKDLRCLQFWPMYRIKPCLFGMWMACIISADNCTTLKMLTKRWSSCKQAAICGNGRSREAKKLPLCLRKFSTTLSSQEDQAHSLPMKDLAASTGTWFRNCCWLPRKPLYDINMSLPQRVLVEKYYDICTGLGFNKSPDVFGAFPPTLILTLQKGRGRGSPV